jgi:hypothetical protein
MFTGVHQCGGDVIRATAGITKVTMVSEVIILTVRSKITVSTVMTSPRMRRSWVMASSSHLTTLIICHVGITDCRKLVSTGLDWPQTAYHHTKFDDYPISRSRVILVPTTTDRWQHDAG